MPGLHRAQPHHGASTPRTPLAVRRSLRPGHTWWTRITAGHAPLPAPDTRAPDARVLWRVLIASRLRVAVPPGHTWWTDARLAHQAYLADREISDPDEAVPTLVD